MFEIEKRLQIDAFLKFMHILIITLELSYFILQKWKMSTCRVSRKTTLFPLLTLSVISHIFFSFTTYHDGLSGTQWQINENRRNKKRRFSDINKIVEVDLCSTTICQLVCLPKNIILTLIKFSEIKHIYNMLS